MGCPEGGPDGNRQHVWDLQQGMRDRPGTPGNQALLMSRLDPEGDGQAVIKLESL
jgi:hypothetical protein